MKLAVHLDGPSRGNPVHACDGFTIEKNGVVFEEDFGSIGLATGNVTNYTAFVAAFKRMKTLDADEVVPYSVHSSPYAGLIGNIVSQIQVEADIC